MGLGLTYQDSSFINNGNTAILPSYSRIDAAAYYEVSDTLRVQVNLENVTDELYFPNSHSTHQATVGAPLNARLAIIGRCISVVSDEWLEKREKSSESAVIPQWFFLLASLRSLAPPQSSFLIGASGAFPLFPLSSSLFPLGAIGAN